MQLEDDVGDPDACSLILQRWSCKEITEMYWFGQTTPSIVHVFLFIGLALFIKGITMRGAMNIQVLYQCIPVYQLRSYKIEIMEVRKSIAWARGPSQFCTGTGRRIMATSLSKMGMEVGGKRVHGRHAANASLRWKICCRGPPLKRFRFSISRYLRRRFQKEGRTKNSPWAQTWKKNIEMETAGQLSKGWTVGHPPL